MFSIHPFSKIEFLFGYFEIKQAGQAENNFKNQSRFEFIITDQLIQILVLAWLPVITVSKRLKHL